MAEKHTTRIDKWLWAVRVFKTRAMARDACSSRKVTIGEIAVKASRYIQKGDTIKVRKGIIKYIYKV